MNAANDNQSIDVLLEQQQEQVETLLEVLEQETAAIAERSAKNIEVLAKQKQQLVSTIQRLDGQLASHSNVESLKENNVLKEQVELVRQALKHCQTLNESNGVALQRASLSMHRLRNLFQETAGKQELTYNIDGQTSGKRSLGTNIKA